MVSVREDSAEFWLDLLGQAMTDPIALEKFLSIPAIQFHYQNCGLSGCDCPEGGDTRRT